MIEKHHAHYYHSWNNLSLSAGSDNQHIENLCRVRSAPDILTRGNTQAADEKPAKKTVMQALSQVANPQRETLHAKNKPFVPSHDVSEKNSMDINNNHTSKKDAVYIEIPEYLLSATTLNNAKKERSYSAPSEIKITISSENGADASDIKAETLRSLIERYGKNINQALGQKLLSVGISTALREYMTKRGFPALLQHAPASVSVSLGAFALATPIVLQLAGIARDTRNGSQTAASLSARLANLALVTGSVAALSATVGIAATTNALLAAIFVYVPLRDIIQYFLPLRDNNPPGINLCASASTALLYSVNQALVSEGMSLMSGALQPALEPDFAEVCGKALVNTLGETIDEITWRRLNARFKDNPALRVQWGVRPAAEINTKTLIDQLLNTIAARAALFGTSYSIAAATPLLPLLNSMITGATLGVSYLPFVYNHSQSQPGADKV